MTYKTIVTEYAPKARKMADEIEKVINEKAKDGWELVTFSVTNSCKAILVFRVPERSVEDPEERKDKISNEEK